MMYLQVTGVKRVETAIRRAGKKIHRAAIYGTHNWMKGTMNFSRQLAPEDTGALKATTYAFMDTKTGVGQMGFAVWYAERAHSYNKTGVVHFLAQPVMNRSLDGSLGKEVRAQLHQKRVSKKKYSVQDTPDVTTALSLRPGSVRR